MKETFLGTVYTTTNKAHDCFACWKKIHAGNKTRHDVWKEDKTVINKYYCKTCDAIVRSIGSIAEKPYNPRKNNFKDCGSKIFDLFVRLFYLIMWKDATKSKKTL